jgi:hypothetical protein
MITLTVYYKGKEYKLTDKNYLSEGGQGKIYLKDGIIFKINHDTKDAIPLKYLQELSVLQRDNIIKPIDHVCNEHSLPIGYAMKYVQDTVPLPRLFTTGFRTRANFTPDMAVKLVEEAALTIQYIHERDVIIVDGNEFNYLIDGSNLTIPYFIDVDGYQTKSFPAKVIMPSIRDWQSKDFNPMTDWYSFAIIATQIFVGIHPFKGTHPNFQKNDLKARQLANISIFNKDVSVPPATRDFSLIPSEYMNWFIDEFEKGKRTLPPMLAGKIIVKPTLVISTGKDKFTIDKIFDADSRITGCVWAFGNRVLFTEKSVYLDSHDKQLPSKTAGVVYFENNPYLVDIVGKKLIVKHYHNSQVLSDSIAATKKLIIDNRIYVINDDKLMEIKFSSISGKTFVTVGNVWNVLPNSTHAFREIVYSDVLGKPYFYVPFKEGSCAILQVPELTKHKIVDAKYENGVCMLMTFENNEYHRATIKFNQDFSGYAFEIEKDVILSSINFVTLPNSIYMYYTGEGEMVIGSRFKSEKRVFTNIKFANDISLCHNGLEVYYYSENALY